MERSHYLQLSVNTFLNLILIVEDFGIHTTDSQQLTQMKNLVSLTILPLYCILEKLLKMN